ncbi:choice-of-anchor I family protein [Luteolibacter marinus]|uniref:choice-of-anchor I family protein n=1 Tax=Luteolibacter marinus TaxID=2776705 RepID=UPI00186782D7|nr:choice-of-anchor I family protein [Luteolibacter marinus]
MFPRHLPLASGLALGLASGLAHADLSLTPVGTVRFGDAASLFDQSAAEIVAFDARTNRVYVVNGSTDGIDVIDAADPSNPVALDSVDLSEFGNPNSIAVHPRLDEIAVAIGNNDKSKRGVVVFLDSSLAIKDVVEVGYLPDMLTYDSTGRRLVVANEAEPTDDYSVDPEGSVSIIESTGRSGRHRVTEITFGSLTDEDVARVRISGPEGTTIAQDLEPEYIAIDDQDRFAYVTCQENNAILTIDLNRKQIDGIFGLGFKDHSALGNALDASDKDDMIRLANWPVKGLYMPDGIATYSAGRKGLFGRIGRETYLVTANEGDAREWGDYLDESRVKDLDLDPSAFPLGDLLKENEAIGRLNVITTQGDVDGDGDYDELYSFGARSFSIFSTDGELVFDSGDMIERYIADHFPDDFNADHGESGSFDNRSDNKGPEPETVEIGTIGEKTYAFVGLERISGVMVFDITDPHQVSIVTYAHNRDFSVEFDEENLDNVAAAGDLGPEGIEFVPADESASGKPLLVVGNEVSGTTTIYEISLP